VASRCSTARLMSEGDQIVQAFMKRALGVPLESRRIGPLEVRGTELIFHIDKELEELLAQKRNSRKK
jgi:hypothetical protein